MLYVNMKNLSYQKITKQIFKILKIKNLQQLLNLKRKDYDKWDSLAHLEIIFFLEKNFKKLSKKKIINLNSGKSLNDLIRKNIKEK